MDTGQRRLMAMMPLHAITSTYGEQGLRERFAMEIASFSEQDKQRLNQALDLAARLHAADRREREPYLNHLLRVAIRIMSHYGVHDTDVICAALLHDAVEDHAAELAGSLDDQPAALAVLAGAVSNPQYAPDRDAHEQYREHVAESLRRHPWARVIKASDFTDNGAGLIHTSGPPAQQPGREVRAAGPDPAGAHQPPRYPPQPRGQAAHPDPARPGRGAVRRRAAAGRGLVREQGVPVTVLSPAPMLSAAGTAGQPRASDQAVVRA